MECERQASTHKLYKAVHCDLNIYPSDLYLGMGIKA